MGEKKKKKKRPEKIKNCCPAHKVTGVGYRAPRNIYKHHSKNKTNGGFINISCCVTKSGQYRLRKSALFPDNFRYPAKIFLLNLLIFKSSFFVHWCICTSAARFVSFFILHRLISQKWRVRINQKLERNSISAAFWNDFASICISGQQKKKKKNSTTSSSKQLNTHYRICVIGLSTHFLIDKNNLIFFFFLCIYNLHKERKKESNIP